MRKKEHPDAKEEDDKVWQAVTRDIKPLKGKKYKKPTDRPEKEITLKSDIKIKKPTERILNHTAPKSRDIDRRSAERLRKGEMKIEKRLDLHGMTQDEARDALRSTLLNSYESGKRCVLIITGKGRQENERPFPPDSSPRGILKSRVPEWLEQPPLRALVLRTEPARPRHGGEGALYILLRKNKDLA